MNATGAGITAQSVAPLPVLLQAPAHWRCIDFISDLHLQAGACASFDAWQRYMQNTQADAVFILGDLFEVWIGDDVLHGGAPDAAVSPAHPVANFEACCAQVLAAASHRLSLYFIHGNRDFLLGPAFASACGMTLLGDPCVLEFGGQRWLLSHGDALCLQDTDYMTFRAQVRNAQWQNDFLAQPLARRQALARTMREQSQSHKNGELDNGMSLADLDADACCSWLNAAKANTLIHGHTHRPAEHALAPDRRRLVLSDWDGAASPPRAEVLRLNCVPSNQTARVSVQRLAPDRV